MKGPAYFFNLWGRNFIGNFKVMGNLAKKAPLGTLLALVIGLPVIAVSPITSLFKTIIDYATRSPLPKEQVTKLNNSDIGHRISLLNGEEVTSLVQSLPTYNVRFVFTSRSTKNMLERLAPVKKTQDACADNADDIKNALKAYMEARKNADKRFYKLLASKIIEMSDKHIETELAGYKARAEQHSQKPKSEVSRIPRMQSQPQVLSSRREDYAVNATDCSVGALFSEQAKASAPNDVYRGGALTASGDEITTLVENLTTPQHS